jgi:hypothetical protein
MAQAPAPDGVIFEDPPGVTTGSQKGVVRSEWKLALMERPGEWARIPVAYDAAGVTRHRNPKFEVIARTVAGEKCVYARYIGDAS